MKKYLLILIIVLLTSGCTTNNYNTPSCNTPPIGEHYNIAIEYINTNYPSYSILKESAEGIGPCNGGNTQSTKFNVLQGGKVIGTIIIEGGTNKVTFSLIEQEVAQGIFGYVFISGGACLVDPENPYVCLNKPSPGKASFDIRKNIPYNYTVIKSFESDNDGSFKVELQPGEYCIFDKNMPNVCEKQIIIKENEWLNITLNLALP